MLALYSSSVVGTIQTGVACDKTLATEIVLKWDMYAAETGLYTVEGCVGASPKLMLTEGQTYTWLQTDASNWYHPVGFAYEPGGAHFDCGFDSSGECPELGGENPVSTLEYYVKKPGAADYTLASADEGTGDSGFGLDAYEPKFFYPEEAWLEYGFKVTLTVPDVTKFYYFCHIHAAMSAVIEVVGFSSSAPSPTRTDLFVAPPVISAYDEECGTVDAESFNGHGFCGDHEFVCGEQYVGPKGIETFNSCMNAIDCKMHYEMAVETDADPVATFSRQMIPHHQNAVSMSKILRKFANLDDDFTALTSEIINNQNYQIQTMQAYLDGNGGDGSQCHVSRRELSVIERAAPVAPERKARRLEIQTGVACDKTAATEIVLKWDMFAATTGLYTVEGCVGASPKLMLTEGQTYTWLQTDASNWYHPVGFAYEPGGAHFDCEIDSSGECPELGGESPVSTLEYYVKKPGAADYTLASADEGTGDSGFGLDAYEPLFFYPMDYWSEYEFKVTLTVPDVTKFYYFCHIHAAMSAEIEVVGFSSSAPSPTRTDLFVAPPTISAFDEQCGTVDVESFKNEDNSACAGKEFLCGDESLGGATFNSCMKAIDCKMHYEMAVEADADPVATFVRQMIPHHYNAVSMAKILRKQYGATLDDDFLALTSEIINVQNFQIQTMQAYMDHPDCGAGTPCYASIDGDPITSYQGIQTRYWLSTEHFTPVLEQGPFVLSQLAGPAKPAPGLEAYKGAWVVAAEVKMAGLDTIRIETVDPTTLLEAAPSATDDTRLTTMRVSAGGKQLAAGDDLLLKLNTTVAASRVSGADLQKLKIGRGFTEQIDIQTNGLHLRITTQKANKFADEKLQTLGLHLDFKFLTFDSRAARGALPEMWGLQPMSEATKLLLDEKAARK